MMRRASLTLLVTMLALLVTMLAELGCANAETSLIGRPDITRPAPASSSQEPEHLYAAPTRLDRIGRVVAPVMINGKGPFRLTLDTGANQSVLTTHVANTLGLTASGRNVRLHGVTGSVMVPTVPVARFETGDLIQRDLELPVMDNVMGGADGILGMQGFDNKRITVDFVNDQIRIADSRGQRAFARFIAVPVELRFGRLLLVTGRVGGVKVRAVIDTGAERTLGNLALREALIRRKRPRLPPLSTSVIGLTEEEQRGDVIHTPRINLGDVSISDAFVVYGDIHVFKLWDLEDQPALLVGMDVLGTLHTLVIDYRRKELQIKVHASQIRM